MQLSFIYRLLFTKSSNNFFVPVIRKPSNIPSTFSESEIHSILKYFALYKENWKILKDVRQGQKVLQTFEKQGTARKAYVSTNHTDYILKEFPWYASTSIFATSVLGIQHYLSHNSEIPIPRYIAAKGDATVFFIQSELGQIYTLQTLVSCVEWIGSYEQINASARLLNRLHRACLSIPEHYYTPGLTCENLFDNAIKFLNTGYIELINNNTLTLTTSQIKQLEDLIAVYSEHISLAKARAESSGYFDTKFIIHGDYHQHNVLFGRYDEVVGIIDFDNCNIDNPVNDVARILLCIGFYDIGHKSVGHNALPRTINKYRIREFLSVYFRDNPLYTSILNNLSAAMHALSLELAFLGLLTNRYKFSQLDKLLEFPRNLNEMFQKETFI